MISGLRWPHKKAPHKREALNANMMVEHIGLEPMTSSMPLKRSSQLS
jgi:hypothetical protein